MSLPIIAKRIHSLLKWEWGEQRRICKTAEVSPATLNNIYCGHIPRADTLRKLAVALCTSTDYLVGLTDDPTPTHKEGKHEGQAEGSE